MRNALVFLLFGLVLFTNSHLQAATPTGDNWDDVQLHGWGVNTAWTQISAVGSGGNPGGYLLSSSDPQGNPSNVIGAANEEDRYSGNYAAAGINHIAVDLNLLSGQSTWVVLRLRYHDATHNGWTYRLAEDMPSEQWIHYEVNFDPNWLDTEAIAAGWQQEPLTPSFQETMSDVYFLEVRLLTPDVNATTLGIDNVSISGGSAPAQMATPVPALGRSGNYVPCGRHGFFGEQAYVFRR